MKYEVQEKKKCGQILMNLRFQRDYLIYVYFVGVWL